VPEFLTKMKFDEWRDIRFDSEQALWLKEKLPFTIQFFHPGLYYTKTVNIYTVDASTVQPVPFSTDLFKYGKNDFKDRGASQSGIRRVSHPLPINVEAYRDEVAVFLGASYFRAVAKKQNYGLSARGLAIDTGLPSGEEFPSFTDFWIVKPEANAKKLTCMLSSIPSASPGLPVRDLTGKETWSKSRAGSSSEKVWRKSASLR